MSARRIAAGLALSLVAQVALADHAQPRGGGSSHSSSVGAQHHSSSGSSSGSSASSSGRSRSASESSSPPSGAERRHPRAGTGTGYRHGYYGRPYYRGYYYGYGYYPYYSLYDFDDYYGAGYYGSGYYGAGYYPYYRHRYGSSYDGAGSVRVLVEPSEARVYVDGYYAGIVDDFDGLFQRLYIAPGRHEITLKLEGYRTHRMKIYVPYGHTIKIHCDMVKGTGEDAPEDLAGSADRYESEEHRSSRNDRDDAEADDDADRAERPRPGADRREHGELRLSVHPDDASVYVDGEFQGSGRQARSLDLPPGRHRIEVVRPGFRTFEREVEVRRDEPVDLKVELERP